MKSNLFLIAPFALLNTAYAFTCEPLDVSVHLAMINEDQCYPLRIEGAGGQIRFSLLLISSRWSCS